MCSPAVLPAQDDSRTPARHSKTGIDGGKVRFIPAACHRNAAIAPCNYGQDAVQWNSAYLRWPRSLEPYRPAGGLAIGV